ncbi:MAG: hypothetical protein EOP45_02400 [Sphingobacteriaceae bacterium]|nr:MAG: hypothetical protein EOP45_02400 [Sphingobacteriaceae bacterium]
MELREKSEKIDKLFKAYIAALYTNDDAKIRQAAQALCELKYSKSDSKWQTDHLLKKNGFFKMEYYSNGSRRIQFPASRY